MQDKEPGHCWDGKYSLAKKFQHQRSVGCWRYCCTFVGGAPKGPLTMDQASRSGDLHHHVCRAPR